MSVDYTTLPDPCYSCGNSQDFHSQMKKNIISDLNPDGTYESNFCLTNAPNPQNITSQHIFHTTPAINADVDPSTNNRLCHRGYVLRQIGNVLTNDNAFSGSNTFSGVSVFSNDIRCNQDPSLNNSLCRKSYVDTSVATCQPLITSSTDIVCKSVTTTNAISVSGNFSVSGTMTVPSASISQASINGLTTALNGKQASLTSSSDIVVNSLNTIPAATIAYMSGLTSNIQTQITALSGGGGTATNTNNAWTGTNSFNTSNPTTTVVASGNYDIPNKLYVDTQVATKTTLSAIQSNNNAFTGTTTFNTTLPTSTVVASGNYDIPNKLYVDTQVATKTTLANVLSNNSTFSGTNTFSNAPTMSGANITSATIPMASLASGALTVTSLTCSSETDTGNLLANSYCEKLNSIGNNGTTNNYTLDFSTGSVFILSTAPTGSMTIILNNCGTATTKTINFTMIYNTTLHYYANSVSCYSDTGSTAITLSSSTPLFSNGVTTFSSSTVMIQTFTLIRNFASNYILSNVVSYY